MIMIMCREWNMIRQTCDKVNEKRVNEYEKQGDKRRGTENISYTIS